MFLDVSRISGCLFWFWVILLFKENWCTCHNHPNGTAKRRSLSARVRPGQLGGGQESGRYIEDLTDGLVLHVLMDPKKLID